MREDKEKWDRRYQARTESDEASPLVVAHAGLALPGKALDIAAGQGRNALYLARTGFRVEAVDISETALSHMSGKSDNLYPVCADLDHFDIPGGRYRLIVNIRFLSRRLFPQILEGLCPGGVLVFEALLAAGEPENGSSHPEYRLQSNELLRAFSSLRIVHYRETVPAGEGETPTASLVGIQAAFHNFRHFIACFVSVIGAVFERNLDPGPIGHYFAPLHLHVELGDFGNSQLPEAFTGGFNRLGGRIFPGRLARANQFDDLVYAVSHDGSPFPG
jgi:SAM-dependent methyltransferase